MDLEKRSKLTKAFNDFIVALFFFIFACLAVFTPPHVFANENVYCPAENEWTGLVYFPYGTEGLTHFACMEDCQYVNRYGVQNICNAEDNHCYTDMASTGIQCLGTEDSIGDTPNKPDVTTPPEYPDECTPENLPDCEEPPDTSDSWVTLPAPIEVICTESTQHLCQAKIYNAINSVAATNKSLVDTYFRQLNTKSTRAQIDTLYVKNRVETDKLATTLRHQDSKANYHYEKLSEQLDSLDYTAITDKLSEMSDVLDYEVASQINRLINYSANIESYARQIPSNFSTMMGYLGQTNYNVTQLQDDTAELKTGLDSLSTEFSAMQPTIDDISSWSKAAKNNSATAKNRAIEARDAVNALQTSTDAQFASLTSDISATNDAVVANGLAIAALGDTGGSGDMSGVESGIGESNNLLSDIRDSIGCDGDCLAGFTPEGKTYGSRFLYDAEKLTQIQNAIDVLKYEATQEIQNFRNLFSFDTTAMNNGTYKDHSLDLFVNGQAHSFKSGVLPALIDNATLIASIILFIAVLLGIKSLGN
ncbi:hypothetical protein L4D20_04300 [Vibrio kyushuensis]|uniref:hypothetical protein n=1 Tax=Vibrio kyushuensis TaxID=2910249 RepID=UPI003D0F470D